MLVAMADGCVSLTRVQQFLELPEINRTRRIHAKSKSSKGARSQAYVKVTNASFTWLPSTMKTGSNVNLQALSDTELRAKHPHTLESKAGLLKNIDLSIVAGDSPLVLIFGSTGSNKSSLLQAILGEMPRVCGRLKCAGSVAYVQQVPFLMTGTVR